MAVAVIIAVQLATAELAGAVREPRAPLPAGSLASVSCVAGGWCAAVGSYGPSGSPLPLIEHRTGGRWAQDAAPRSTDPSHLDAVSCTSRRACVAIGEELAQRHCPPTFAGNARSRRDGTGSAGHGERCRYHPSGLAPRCLVSHASPHGFAHVGSAGHDPQSQRHALRPKPVSRGPWLTCGPAGGGERCAPRHPRIVELRLVQLSDRVHSGWTGPAASSDQAIRPASQCTGPWTRSSSVTTVMRSNRSRRRASRTRRGRRSTTFPAHRARVHGDRASTSMTRRNRRHRDFEPTSPTLDLRRASTVAPAEASTRPRPSGCRLLRDGGRLHRGRSAIDGITGGRPPNLERNNLAEESPPPPQRAGLASNNSYFTSVLCPTKPMWQPSAQRTTTNGTTDGHRTLAETQNGRTWKIEPSR